MKIVKNYSAEVFLLGTFITRMSSFDLILPQIILKFLSANLNLLSELSHVLSKSNHANDFKTLAKESKKRRHARKCR